MRRWRSDDVRARRVRAARAVVDDVRRRATRPTYGINTGFGSFAEVRSRATRSRSCRSTWCAAMPRASASRCRCRWCAPTMALRANVLAKGYSGIRLETLELLVDAAEPAASIRSCRRAARSAPAAISRRWRIWRWC